MLVFAVALGGFVGWRAIADREALAVAGLGRARSFSWRASAEKTIAVYAEAIRR